MALRSSKNQIDGIVSRIFVHSHCKARNHNPKGGCACREKKKKSLISSHILCLRFEHKMENGNRLLKVNSLYWYKAIVRCTHLAAYILQHGFKFGGWLMVNKISNHTVHHRSVTKSAPMLQDIKKYQPVKLPIKYLLNFWYCAKKTIANIFNHVKTDWLIMPLLIPSKKKLKA